MIAMTLLIMWASLAFRLAYADVAVRGDLDRALAFLHRPDAVRLGRARLPVRARPSCRVAGNVHTQERDEFRGRRGRRAGELAVVLHRRAGIRRSRADVIQGVIRAPP